MTSKDCPVGAFNKTVKSTNVDSVVLWRNLMMIRCLIIETIARSTQLTIEINYHVEKRLASTSLYPNISIAPPGRLRILAVGAVWWFELKPFCFPCKLSARKIFIMRSVAGQGLSCEEQNQGWEYQKVFGVHFCESITFFCLWIFL